MKKSRTLATSTLILVAGSIASKLLGFMRESVLAYFYGATKVTDAYIIALSIPAFILLGIGGAIGTSTISVASRIENEKGQNGVFKLVSTLANSAVLLSTVLMLLGLGFIRPLIASLAPGFDAETLALTSKLTMIMIPTAVLSLLQSVFNALLQYKGDFSINALSGALQNVLTIGFVIAASRYVGITAAAIGALVSSVAITAMQLYRLSGIGYRHTWSMDLKNEGFISVLKMLVPLMVASAVSQVGAMIIRSMGTNLAEGAVAFINYAQKLIQMPYAIIGASIITVFYPTIARQFHEGGKSGFLSSLHKSMSTLYFALAPIAAGAMFLAPHVVRLVYQRGAFTSDMTAATSIVLVYLSVSMPFMGIADMFSKALFVMQDTITPLIVTIVSTAFAIALAWVLSPSLSYAGLAIALSAQYLVSLILSSALFNRKLRKSGQPGQADAMNGSAKGLTVSGFTTKLLITFGKTSAATLAMMGSLYLSRMLIGGRMPLAGTVKAIAEIVLYTGIGGVVFILAAAILKADELMFLMSTARGFLEKFRRKLAR